MWCFSIFTLFFITAFLYDLEVEGWVAQGNLQVRNGNCVDEEDNEHADGETWTGPHCIRHTCSVISEDEAEDDIAGCGIVAGPPECHLEDGTGDYPDCCPHIVCDSDEEK